MSNDITHLVNLDVEIKQIDSELLKLRTKRDSLWSNLKKQCHHPTTISKNRYFSGSYDHTASTEYWDECTICGTKLNQKTKNHNYYG